MAFLCDSDGTRKNLHPISMRKAAKRICHELKLFELEERNIRRWYTHWLAFQRLPCETPSKVTLNSYQRYTQQDKVGPTTKPTKSELVLESRHAVPKIKKKLLFDLQNNPHETNPLYNSLTIALENAFVDYLRYDPRGKEFMKIVGNEADFSRGPVNLPVESMPNTLDYRWTQIVGNQPFEIKRGDYPLNQDGTYQPHPTNKNTEKTSSDDGLHAIATAMMYVANSRQGIADIANAQPKVYFTRLTNGVTLPSYVNLVENESVMSHVLKLKTENDPQYQDILQRAKDGYEIIFVVSQIDAPPLVIPICRANNSDANMGVLLKDSNIKKPIIIDVSERPIRERRIDDNYFCKNLGLSTYCSILSPPPQCRNQSFVNLNT
jgi:hypothetical protein